MEIEKIIYETTRGCLNLEDKLSIATIFIFCEKSGVRKLAELLYNDCIETFLDDMQEEYINYDVDFSIRLDKREVSNAFFLTLDKYKEKNDSSGFYKAVYEKDPYALVICDIVNYKFDAIEFKKFTTNLSEQLKFNF
ncbi:hypothetical protein D3C86_537420 [compost metagenome]